MSIRLIDLAWKCPLELDGTTMLVLVRLCGFASDDGGGVYPAVKTVAGHCRISERTVRYALRRLEELSILVKVADEDAATRRAREYRINVGVLERGGHLVPPCTTCPPATGAPLHAVQATGAPDAEGGGHHVPPNRYLESSENRPGQRSHGVALSGGGGLALDGLAADSLGSDEGDTVDVVAKALQRVSTTPLSLKTVQEDIKEGLREGVALSQYRELATTLRALPVEHTDAISVTRAIRQLRPVAAPSTSTAPAFALDPPATAAEKAKVRAWMDDSHGSVEAWLKASKALAEEGLPESHGKFGSDAWVAPLVALLRLRPNTDHWRQTARQKVMAL